MQQSALAAASASVVFLEYIAIAPSPTLKQRNLVKFNGKKFVLTAEGRALFALVPVIDGVHRLLSAYDRTNIDMVAACAWLLAGPWAENRLNRV